MTLAGRWLAAVLVAAGGLGAPAAAAGSEAWARSAFLERCGGCHGLDGKAAAAVVPDLRDQVGYFLCTPQGRAYVGRLPNVAFSAVSDQQLAEIVNYAVFKVGGSSAPSGAKPYTAAEIGRLRHDPLTATDLVAQRSRVAEGVIKSCPMAKGLRTYKNKAAVMAAEKEAAP